MPTGFSTIFLATSRQRGQRPAAGFGQANRWATGRTSRSEPQKPNKGKPNEKLRRFSARKTKCLAKLSRGGRRHAKSSSLQFQERGFSPRQFPMRARAQDSAAQSRLGNEQQAALQKLQEVERSGGGQPGSVVMAACAPRSYHGAARSARHRSEPVPRGTASSLADHPIGRRVSPVKIQPERVCTPVHRAQRLRKLEPWLGDAAARSDL